MKNTTKFYVKGYPRFTYEYTNHVYDYISNHSGNAMQSRFKHYYLERISKYFSLLMHDLITVDDYMKSITNILDTYNSKMQEGK